VVHEFAHKLDMLNGSANGMPPLRRGSSGRRFLVTLLITYSSSWHIIIATISTHMVLPLQQNFLQWRANISSPLRRRYNINLWRSMIN